MTDELVRRTKGLRLGCFGMVIMLAAAIVGSPAAAQSSAAFQQRWSALLTAAKKEGQLVLSTGAIPQYQPLFNTFTKKFGIPVQVDGGSGSARATRILAERSAGKYTVDAGMLSVAATTRRLEPARALESLPPLLIDPDVTNTANWYGGRHWYADKEGTKTIFVYTVEASNSWLFWYNTKKVSAQDVAFLKSPWDFLDPKWKGKMGDQSWGDPGRLGGMLDTYFSPDAGPEWIKKYFTEMDVSFTSDPRLEEDWIVRGSKPLKWSEGDIGQELRKYRNTFPIKPGYLERKQGKLEARGSECCVVIFKGAPHPHAAQLFVNWFLSKEGQSLVNRAKPPQLYTSLREDIPTYNTYVEARRIKGKDYLFRDFDANYRAKEKEARAFIINTFEQRMKH